MAANEWQLCRHHLPAFQGDATLGEKTLISADYGLATGRNLYEMSGKVAFVQAKQSLYARRAVYDKGLERLDAYDNVSITTADALFQGDSSRMWLANSTGTINHAQFQLRANHARGDAEQIIFESEDVTVLKKATYTTCDPTRRDWLMTSSKIRLDRSTGMGSAHHAVLSFMHVPFFYLPYISFPIDDRRKSGVLPPAYRRSELNGVDFSVPYYLNLSPHRDATVTPRNIEKRGVVLNSEFRYLHRRNRGILNLEYMGRDRLYEKEMVEGGGKRGKATFTHSGNPLQRIHTNIDLSYVTDPDYLSELGSSLSTSSVTHLQRSADIRYQGDDWSSKLRVQSYQTVDDIIPESARPYKRLPQLTFNSLRPIEENTLNYSLSGEYVAFERRDRLTGRRLDLKPTISLPLSTDAAYFTPSLMVQHSRYDLTRLPGDLTTTDVLTRTLPLLTLDSGVFFERDTNIASRVYLHTLEPRLMYVYIPYREQSDIPVFDSGTPSFSFSRLFSTNRFSGIDRIGDTSRVTLAVTTRLIDQQTGVERLNASIGQIYYLRDRRVTLAADNVDKLKKTDIVAQSSAYLRSDLRINANYQWDVDLHKVAKGSLQFNYNPAKRRILNVGYRYRNLSQSQVDASILWPIPHTRRWHIIGRKTRSLLDETTIESFIGLEYQTCCWKLHIVKHRFLNKALVDQAALPGGEGVDPYDRSIFIQLELKGMGKLGKTIDDLLENGILGYSD
ncbi:MAG: LPS-assembly protein LptD [Thiotrichaceae bacterium]|nr:LPS-assembly protein LptD [Thiotrichaceae bacterium]